MINLKFKKDNYISLILIVFLREARMIENGSKNKEKITDLFITTVADYNPKSEEAYAIKEMLK